MNINKKEYVVFILSFGRADKVYTYKTLKKQGYTGEIYLICSDDDKNLNDYKNTFENVYVFSKDDYVNTFDIADNFDDKRVVVYARNAVFDIAKELGYKYFIVLDDDYKTFRYTVDNNYNYLTKQRLCKDLDFQFNALLKYYKSIKAKTLCIAQDGDFIGGAGCSVFQKKLSRKAMNFFVCSTDRRFNFVGRINEDVNTYVHFGSKGDLFLTICELRLNQLQTQQNTGGLTEFYLDGGTYVKSFYTLIFNPSSVRVSLVGTIYPRLHHRINWNNTVPRIIDETFKK
tara:strand:- start:223 stop:1080 length:858 start_codon:yes stop_codon:yes gene_type:complete